MAARAVGVQAKICYDFDDQALVKEVNLDTSLEVPLAGVFLGTGTAVAPMPATVLSRPSVAGSGQDAPVKYDILSDVYQAGTRIAGKPEKIATTGFCRSTRPGGFGAGSGTVSRGDI